MPLLDKSSIDIGTYTVDQKIEALDNFKRACQQLQDPKLNNYAALLPYLIRLDGRPFSLDEYRPFEALYTFDAPEAEILICGRQVSKSTNLAVRGTVAHAVQEYLRSLYVLPLQEMSRRLSSNFFDPLIRQSPLRKILVDGSCSMRVEQKTFRNNSAMYFTYAFLDCDRARGYPVDEIGYDEVQDLDHTFIPIIDEALSASQLGWRRFSGTPKTTDNTLNLLNLKSSQGEWFIRCGCGNWNIPSLEFDVFNMIGPLANVEKYGTGLICAKCGKPIDGKAGQWVHQYPDRINTFAGYHVPQIILPLHYANVDKWRKLLVKRNGDLTIFLNECLGIASDVAAKLVSLDDLKTAGVLDVNNDIDEALHFCKRRYKQILMGVDWGGGGVKEVSRTVVSIIGIMPNNNYEVPYIEQFYSSMGGIAEVVRIMELFSLFGATHIGHDYGGAGQQREDLMIQAGFPIDRLLPFSYVRATTQPMIVRRDADGKGSRSYYALDKTRSLLVAADLIKTGMLRFAKYDSCNELLEQYLALQNEMTTPKRGGSINLVTTRMGAQDDVPQSVNFGLAAAYRVMDHFPNIARVHQPTLSKLQLRVASPGASVEPGEFDPTFRV